MGEDQAPFEPGLHHPQTLALYLETLTWDFYGQLYSPVRSTRSFRKQISPAMRGFSGTGEG